MVDRPAVDGVLFDVDDTVIDTAGAFEPGPRMPRITGLADLVETLGLSLHRADHVGPG